VEYQPLSKCPEWEEIAVYARFVQFETRDLALEHELKRWRERRAARREGDRPCFRMSRRRR
jgi:hypothetical protein